MFSTTTQKAEILNFKPAKEMHGDQKKLVGDLKVRMKFANTVLDHFGDGIRNALYRKPAPGEEPRQSDLLPDDSDGLTALRNPHLEPLHANEKFPGYSAEFQSGLAVNDPIKLKEIVLSSFTIEAMDGGTVELTFNMRFPVDGQYSGKLCQLIQDSVELTLTPPSADDAQQDLAA